MRKNEYGAAYVNKTINLLSYTCIKKKLEQEKYTHLSKNLERITKLNKIPIDEILHRSNEEIKPISEMEEDRNQKVVIFDDYVCEMNQGDIINYFIQGRHKNYFVIYISQSYYKTPKDIRLHIILFLKVLLNGRMKQYVMSRG